MLGSIQDLRYAGRTLAKQPGFTLAVILILGLGMGAATAVVDLVNLLAWRKLPVERPDELVKVFTSNERGFVGPYYLTSYRDYTDYRDGGRSFSGLAAFADVELRLDTGEATDFASATAVSGNFFEVLGLGTVLGRPLGPEDDRPGSAPALVLGHHLWQRLGADDGVLGKTVQVEGRAFTVAGVGPRGYTNLNAGTVTDVFLPVAHLPGVTGESEAQFLDDRNRANVYLIGRLGDGVSRAEAAAELTVMARRLDAEHPRTDDAERRISALPANVVHPIDLQRMKPSLRLFAGAVALLLLITCANVAHLLLARAVARRREMGVRLAIGAGRGRLVRQVLTESLLLALGGGVCGLLLAYWARAFLVAFAGPEFAGEMRFDGRVLGASFLLSLAVTLLFGLAPALAASRVNLVSALKSGGESGERRRVSAGQLLSAAQVALCVVLLVAGALLGQSLWHRLNADLGFDDESLLIARLELSQEYSRDEGKAFYRHLQEGVEALPGVERAGIAWLMPPLLFDITLPFELPEDPGNPRSSRINIVDGGYFRTLGIPLEQGRFFDARDAESGQPVAIVNRLMAETLWPGESPLGRTIRSEPSRPTDPGPDYTVVGVVGSVAQHRSGLGGEPVIYYSSLQRHRPNRQLVVRPSAGSEGVLDSVRGLLREMDPELALQYARTGEMNRREAFAIERMQALSVGLFAAFGFVLALLGIFGVLSYSVSRRVRDVGIRMALGARRRDVLRQVVGQGLRVTLAGIVLGLAGTFFASRLLESLLAGVEPGDGRVLAAVVVTVLAAACGAAYWPARRASRLDPLEALRHE